MRLTLNKVSIEKASILVQSLTILLLLSIGLNKFLIFTFALFLIKLLLCCFYNLTGFIIKDCNRVEEIQSATQEIAVVLISPFIYSFYCLFFVQLYHVIRFFDLLSIYKEHGDEFELPFIFTYLLNCEEDEAYLIEIREQIWRNKYRVKLLSNIYVFVKSLTYSISSIIQDFLKDFFE